MNNPMLEKLKKPKYAFFFFLRAIGASIASATSMNYFSEGLILNAFLWMILCVQFLFDSETFKESFKINRNLFVLCVLVVIVIINFSEISNFFSDAQ